MAIWSSDTCAQYNCGASAVSELGGSNTGDSQREQINPQLSNMTDKHKSITAKLLQALSEADDGNFHHFLLIWEMIFSLDAPPPRGRYI